MLGAYRREERGRQIQKFCFNLISRPAVEFHVLPFFFFFSFAELWCRLDVIWCVSFYLIFVNRGK